MRAHERYQMKAYEEVKLRIPKGAKRLFAQSCEENGTTMQGALNEFIREYTGVAREDWTYKYFAEIDKRPV